MSASAYPSIRPERSREHAQSMAEFAIVLSVLVLMILVIIDLGRITYTYSALHNAAREGTRFGTVDFNWNNKAAIEAHTRNYAIGLNLDPSVLVIQIPDPPLIDVTSGQREKSVKVIANYKFRTASGILHLLTRQPFFELEASSKMTLEYLDDGS